MNKIGVVVREMSYLKLLLPIIKELGKSNKYVLYYMDSYKGLKEYNRPTLIKLKQYPEVIGNSLKVKAFINDKQLKAQLIHDKINKIVSVEIWLWAKSYIDFFKKNNIKTYSILYLTDSIWHSSDSIKSMFRIYYTTKHTMQTHLDFSGTIFDSKRDRSVGSPLFDCVMNKPPDCNNILLLMPNLRPEHVGKAFGNTDNFIKIVEKLHQYNPNLIFKTRKKQWMPPQIKKFAKEIIQDGDKMYPSTISDVLKKTKTVVMFFSSGIYECVYGGNYVVNISLPMKRWSWNISKLNKYFSTEDGSLYNFKGVVQNIDQKQILDKSYKFNIPDIDIVSREQWIDKFIGAIPINSSKIIVQDILIS